MAELNVSTGKPGRKNLAKRMPLRVDLTAMVDLAFLLITFFMLTTSLAKPRAMPLAMLDNTSPPTVKDGWSDKRTMTIDLGKNDKILWYLGMADRPLTVPKIAANEKELRMAILETRKQVLISTGKDMLVLIKPTDHSVYANLVDALDEVNITNIPSYAIVAISPTDVNLLKQKGIY